MEKKVNEMFEQIFTPLKCTRIGLENEKENVHVIHMNKNVVIKPHNDNTDFNCSIIGWFIKGLPISGNFELH